MKTANYPFLEVLNELNKNYDGFVLVGGWVPVVYFDFLWGIKKVFFKTVDIDLGIDWYSNKKIQRKWITESKIFQHKHLDLGKETPYQLVYNKLYPIDFLGDPDDADQIVKHLLGKGIILNQSPEYRFLLKDNLKILCSDVSVRVPDIGRYITHKLYIYLKNIFSRKKDLSTAYFCLSRSPNPDELMSDIGKYETNIVSKFIINEMPLYLESKTSLIVKDIQNSLKTIGIVENGEDIFSLLNDLLSTLKENNL